MGIQEAIITRFEKHIQELNQFTQIPSNWAWWDRKGKKFKKLSELDDAIVQDILDLYQEKWIQPLEASNSYELMQHLGSELNKIKGVIQSLSRFSSDLSRIRDRQLNDINQEEEAERLNIIIGAVNHHLKDVLVGLARTLHRKDTESVCQKELQEFTKRLLEEPRLRKWLEKVYVSGKLLHRIVDDDLILIIKGRPSILKEKERMITELSLHLGKAISKRLVKEVLKQYGFKPELDIQVKLVYNDKASLAKYFGEWQILYEHEPSEWERLVCWLAP